MHRVLESMLCDSWHWECRSTPDFRFDLECSQEWEIL
jgi:hypothetical protein